MYSLPQIERKSDKIVIIGNGPSLTLTMDKYKDDILKYDCMAVNEFGATELFEIIKPRIYVLSDSVYFTLPDNLKESISSLFECIQAKTIWQMQMVIPYSAKNAQSLDIIRKNPRISIIYYYDMVQDAGTMTKFEAWDKNMIAPPDQTVLNTCLYLALYWNYKVTYLIGADTSFLEDVRIDQNTNEIFLANSHFYKSEKVYTNSYYQSGKGVKMSGWALHDLIFAYGNMFKMYAELKEYAIYKGLKVYNASEYSWINVFERKKIE